VPVLGLGTVPFAILQPFTDGSFLIDQMSISIAPSLFDVGQTIPPWDVSRAFSSPLIVGNPYLPPSAEWVIPALPGAEKEAQGVAQIMNVTPLIGKEATKERILSKVQDSSLLYFATHGVASSTNPLSAGFLMFSADRLEQGWWTVKEVQEIRIRETQIAVLSACQTGLGKVHDAGIIGLARAFQIAGVPRVLMSLWSVDDAATSELMQAFIKHLENDIPAEALREAMLEVRKQYPAPSQWASFVLFGTPR
jgi:CHAT domain-containing protein